MWQSLKNIYKNGDFSERILENLVSGNHLRSRKNSSARGSKFRKGDTTALDELIIHSILIPNPFFLKTVSNFNASQPFGLYKIFNYLICSPDLVVGSTLRFEIGVIFGNQGFLAFHSDSWALISCQTGIYLTIYALNTLKIPDQIHHCTQN